MKLKHEKKAHIINKLVKQELLLVMVSKTYHIVKSI